MSKRYELVVFDWDGTLMDSEARIVSCMQRAAADAGFPIPAPAAARDIIGLGMTEAVGRLFPAATPPRVDDLISAYREHWLGNEVKPKPCLAVRSTSCQVCTGQDTCWRWPRERVAVG